MSIIHILKNLRINRSYVSLLYWFICNFLGSIVYSIIFINHINSIPGFEIQFSSSLIFFMIFYAISLICSFPLIFLLKIERKFFRKSNLLNKIILLSILFIIIALVCIIFMVSFYDIIYLFYSYYLSALFFIFIYKLSR